MKYFALLALALAVARATPTKRSSPLGIDISSYQPDIDWTTSSTMVSSSYTSRLPRGHVRLFNLPLSLMCSFKRLFLAYISPTFSSQYTGATNAGLIRGAYHFANPAGASGATQATYFIKHGGESAHPCSVMV